MQTKKLNRVCLVNWMYFGHEILSLNQGSVLLSGENAAGKSTVLDAIQMVLTGNSTRFNKAANENSNRDLRSYVRCKIDTTEKTFLRDGTVISNVALEFYEEKERRWFVIGVHITSGNETEVPAKRWYIENGSRLDDLSFTTAEQKPAMAGEFRNKGEKIQYITTVSDYKEKLRHRLGNLEEKFFEVLLKALAFRPVDNVKDFINKYVLTERRIDVDSLRESIDVLNEFEQTLRKARQERDALERILERYREIGENKRQQETNRVLLQIVGKELLEQERVRCVSQIRINTQKRRARLSEREGLEAQAREIGSRLIQLRQAFENSDYKRLTEKLQGTIDGLQEQKKRHGERQRQLQEYLQPVGQLLSCLIRIKDIPISVEEARCLGIDSDENQKIEVMDRLETFAKAEIKEVQEKRVTTKMELDKFTVRLSELEVRIQDLESKTIHYPAETERLRRCIQDEFKERGIDSPVYILAELLSITDRRWTNAIEGYLNTQRFYLVVEPEHYNLALEIYNGNRKSFSQGIINFRKLPSSPSPRLNSLACLVQAENRFARSYVDYILGNVICCENLQELEGFPSAITRECMVYKNYVSRKIDPQIYGTPYIGKEAIEVQLKKAREEKRQLLEKIPRLRNELEKWEAIEEIYGQVNFDMIREYMDAPNKLALVSGRLEKETEELKQIERNPDIIQLQGQIQEQESNEMTLKEKVDGLRREEIHLETAIASAEREAEEIEGSLRETNAELNAIQDGNAAVFQEASAKYSELSRKKDNPELQSNYLNYQKQLETTGAKLLNGEKNFVGLYQMQGDYNGAFSKDFCIGMEGFGQFKGQFDKLSGVQIVYYEEAIRSARDKCEEIFRNEFLSKMKESIEGARYEFESLKRALKDINYGEDTYKFILAPNAQKRNLYNMIMADDNMGTASLFSNDFESRYKDEIEELFTKIKSGDSTSQAVLEYTDYRSFLDYDIEITKKSGAVQRLSAKAKSSSGGESQVPFYVIMAASLNSIYQSNNSVRLLLLDEAFNNMDEQRISSVMRFFQQLQFQTILVAPSPKIQDIEENVDTVLTVMREDTTSFVEDFRYYGE